MPLPPPPGWTIQPPTKPTETDMQAQIRSASSMAGVPYDVAYRLVKQESGFNPRATNPSGASGLTQLMPGTAKALGVSDVFNPTENLAGGMSYLATQHKNFGNMGYALAAYNWGPGNVQAWIKRGAKVQDLPEETRNYIKTIAPQEYAALANPNLRTGTKIAKMARVVPPPKGWATAPPGGTRELQEPHAPAPDLFANADVAGTTRPSSVPYNPSMTATTTEPGSIIQPLVTGASRAVGTQVGNVFDILNRPHETLTAAMTGGPGEIIPTFIHGQSQQSQDQTRQQVRHLLGGTDANYASEPHAVQGIEDFLVDTITDPLTYAGGSGVLKRAVEGAGKEGFPILARAVEAMQVSQNPNVRRAGAIIAGSHDFVTYKGATKRALAAASGPEGLDQFAALKSINNARKTQGSDLSNTLLEQYHAVTQGLGPQDEAKLYQAIHTGAVADLPPNLAMRAEAFKKVTDSLAHLSGNADLQQHLAAGGFQLPQSLERFGTQGRNLQDLSQYRADYVPTAHDARKVAAEVSGTENQGIAQLDQTIQPSNSIEDILHSPLDPNAKKVETKDLSTYDPALLPRGDKVSLLKPELQARVIENRLRSGAQAVSAADAEKRVASLFGKGSFAKVPAAAREFFRETYTSPENKQWWQHIADLEKSGIDIPKVGLFSLPFRHMANIGSLAVLADPSIAQLTGSVGKYARLLLAGTNAEKRAKILGDSVKYGVSGSPSIDKDAGSWLKNITPKAAIDYATKKGVITPGKWSGWLGKIPGLGDIYKLSSHALWTFDDAVKATRFENLRKQYVAQGIDPEKAAYRAADETGAELIDYSQRSPLTQALSYVAPFATYRSKLPGVIARSVVTHPERTLAIGRADPTLVGDSQQAKPNAKGQSMVTKSYLPLAETLRGVDNPVGFERAVAGYPLQMLASTIGDAIANASGQQNSSSDYFTYGKKPDAKYVLNATLGSLPGGQAVLNATGTNDFAQQEGIGGTIRSQTGMGVTRGPSPREIQAQRHKDMMEAAIGKLRAHGNNRGADALQKRLNTYLRFNRLYVK